MRFENFCKIDFIFDRDFRALRRASGHTGKLDENRIGAVVGKGVCARGRRMRGELGGGVGGVFAAGKTRRSRKKGGNVLDIRFVGRGGAAVSLRKAGKFDITETHAAKNAAGKTYSAKASTTAIRAKKYQSEMPYRTAFWVFLGAFFGLAFGFIAAKRLAREIEKLKKSISERKNKTPPEFKISEISDLSNSSMLISEIGRNRLASEAEELSRSATERELGMSLSEKVFPDFGMSAFGMSLEVAYGRPNLDASFAAYMPSGKIVFGNLDAVKAGPLAKLAGASAACGASVSLLSKCAASEAFGKISAAFKFSSWKIVDFSGDGVVESGFEAGRFYERRYPKEKPLFFSSIESGKALRLYALLHLPKNETMKILSRLSLSNEGGVFIRLEKIK